MPSLSNAAVGLTAILSNIVPRFANNSLQEAPWLQNGGCDLGTPWAPTYNWAMNGPMPQGTPWGNRTAHGVTRYYDFTFSRGILAPDGVELEVLLVNGQTPGPTIEANWGDWISITVHNNLNLGNEGTSVHLHGFLQQQTPWWDGVPAAVQCPITPGTSFTITSHASRYGTGWYHSHYSAQLLGLFGPMVIHGPNNTDYDIDLGPIVLQDWYHKTYTELVQQVELPIAVNPDPVASLPFSDNNLINGKMNFNCSNTNLTCTPNAPLSTFHFTSGKKHRLRLISASAQGLQKFSIDGYSMTIIANDYVPIEPYETDVVTLGPGQRTDVIVEGKGKPTDTVWMRSSIDNAPCSANQGNPVALAIIYYEGASPTTIPTTVSTVDPAQIQRCSNDALSKTVPMYKMPLPEPAVTLTVPFEYHPNDTTWLFWMGGVSAHVNYNDPILLEAKLGRLNFPAEDNIRNMGSNSSVRMIFKNYVPGCHPMHIHGHDFQVLAFGLGEWDGTITNPENSQRRDTQVIPPGTCSLDHATVETCDGVPSYLVVQWNQNNPGVWLLHCHIAWHVSKGFLMMLLERPDDIRKMQIPSVMAQTCRDWAAWTNTHIPDEIDSGL